MKAPVPLLLSPQDRAAVLGILERVLPGAEVEVFGSRATGRARPYSDLDLLIRQPDRLSWVQRADLREAFEASTLPFRVDLVEMTGLAPGMAARILAEARPLR